MVEQSTEFICYAICADEVELMQMRSGTQYSIHSICAEEVDLCNTHILLQFVQIRGMELRVQYSCVCTLTWQPSFGMLGQM